MLLLLLPGLNGNSTAEAAQIAVVISSPPLVWEHGRDGAIGLYVPGAGATVSEEQTIRALERGRVENAVLGGEAGGEKKIDLDNELGSPPSGTPPVEPAIYVALPPPGKHANTRRYPIAVVSPGFHGILTSSSTRIRGLVSVADVADTAEALAQGRQGPIGHAAGTATDVRRLDRRLGRAHDVRDGALAIVVGVLAALGAAAFLLRLRFVARAAVVFGTAALAASLITSGAELEHVTPVLVALAGISLALAAAASFLPRALFVAATLLALLLVLAIDTSINSFGPIGPYPENGGRFYGLSNTQETLLLAPLLAAAANGPWLVPLGIVALVTVGWSHAGADGGGVLVVAAALGVLALRQRGLALTPRRVALVGGAVVLVGVALVGLDAALGGSSHVTRSVGSGSVFDELWHRWRLSAAVIASSVHKSVQFAAAIVGLVWLATRRPRFPTVDAAIVAVVLSLIVNDTPTDVAGIGALGALALLAWERTRPSVDSRPMRRPLLALPLLALVVAGCGSEGTVRATPKTVVGSVQAEAPGKAIFTQQGCNGCHTYQPAGSTATVGPDLDKLPDYAKKAKQPLDQFVHESIVKPGAYVEKGYQDVMPKQYGSLPESDINDLVDFLTKPQG